MAAVAVLVRTLSGVPATGKQPGGAPAGRPGEDRWPTTLATVVAAALYATLPDALLGPARYAIPGLEILLLVPLVIANPKQINRQSILLRRLSFTLVALVMLANTVAFGSLVHKLVAHGGHQGATLLIAALQVWLTNVIGYGLLFWEMDRGGPVVRAHAERDELPPADFRFSQDEDDDNSREVARRASKSSDWRPRFVDYLYVSVTNSTAFSPTDTMPLSPRAKMLMAVECVEALLTSILVIARGVSLLH
jgi:hypothetical protein